MKPITKYPENHGKVNRSICGGTRATPARPWPTEVNRTIPAYDYWSTSGATYIGDESCRRMTGAEVFFGYGYPVAASGNTGFEAFDEDQVIMLLDETNDGYMVMSHDLGGNLDGGRIRLAPRGFIERSTSVTGVVVPLSAVGMPCNAEETWQYIALHFPDLQLHSGPALNPPTITDAVCYFDQPVSAAAPDVKAKVVVRGASPCTMTQSGRNGYFARWRHRSWSATAERGREAMTTDERDAARRLGYSSVSWENNVNVSSIDKTWTQLGETEQKAATGRELGGLQSRRHEGRHGEL